MEIHTDINYQSPLHTLGFPQSYYNSNMSISKVGERQEKQCCCCFIFSLYCPDPFIKAWYQHERFIYLYVYIFNWGVVYREWGRWERRSEALTLSWFPFQFPFDSLVTSAHIEQRKTSDTIPISVTGSMV